MHIARKFELLLEAYPRLDGRAWSGQEIDDATGGVVTRSYVTNLRKGRIENPGFEKLQAIARAMGFSPELWFEENPSFGGEERAELAGGHGSIAQKTEHLFGTIKHQTTGDFYTNAEVARQSFGGLAEEDVEAMRSGALSNPSVDQVASLADVFGIHPSYFLDASKKPPVLDEEAMEIFRDETVSAIAHKSLHLPGREKHMILNIIQQFEETNGADGDD